jgi:hypothetical protein
MMSTTTVLVYYLLAFSIAAFSLWPYCSGGAIKSDEQNIKPEEKIASSVDSAGGSGKRLCQRIPEKQHFLQMPSEGMMMAPGLTWLNMF